MQFLTLREYVNIQSAGKTGGKTLAKCATRLKEGNVIECLLFPNQPPFIRFLHQDANLEKSMSIVTTIGHQFIAMFLIYPVHELGSLPPDRAEEWIHGFVEFLVAITGFGAIREVTDPKSVDGMGAQRPSKVIRYRLCSLEEALNAEELSRVEATERALAEQRAAYVNA